MVLLNTGLCLPAIEVEALAQGQMIVAVPQRFIVPGKRFALYPSKAILNDLKQEDIYNVSFLKEFSSDTGTQPDNLIKVWAQCEFCQHFTDQELVLALTQNTIWSKDALERHLRSRGNLFMAFLRVYKLSDPVGLDIAGQHHQPEQIGRFVPLSQYLDVDEQHPILESQTFEALRQKLTNLEVAFSEPQEIIIDNTPNELKHEKLILENSGEEEVEPPVPTDNSLLVTTTNILDEPNWFTKISEIGNSSDGHTFEKLVRKSLITLGFSNSLDDPKTSLDSNSTGGAGGLDFYCEKPYPVVGECKATKSNKVPASTPAQLIFLGNKHLQTDYSNCVKIIVAAGELTRDASLTAQNNEIGILRPETLQRLVELKVAHPGAFNLFQLEPLLRSAPYSEATDQRVDQFIDGVWKALTLRSLLVEAVRKLVEDGNKPITPQMVRIHFNAALAQDQLPCLQNDDYTRDLLVELSSPLTGYLGYEKYNGVDDFYFIRGLKIED